LGGLSADREIGFRAELTLNPVYFFALLSDEPYQ
jgi:hypothetical protein